MALSAALIPHVTHFDRADITDLEAVDARRLRAAPARQGYLPHAHELCPQGRDTALVKHPRLQREPRSGRAGELILKRHYHLGVAVATDRGLIVPVLRDVDKAVLDLARELAGLAQRVREGKAALDDLRGGTFTVTNIGALGGTGAIPIINYPEVAILALARARLEPWCAPGPSSRASCSRSR
jgi:pyruvate dehydrogenase E2 component (dihydrolipoamide acetyltransferase)